MIETHLPERAHQEGVRILSSTSFGNELQIGEPASTVPPASAGPATCAKVRLEDRDESKAL